MMVRKGGLEPPRYYYRQPLKLVRLPIPPLPRGGFPGRPARLRVLRYGGSAVASTEAERSASTTILLPWLRRSRSGRRVVRRRRRGRRPRHWLRQRRRSRTRWLRQRRAAAHDRSWTALAENPERQSAHDEDGRADPRRARQHGCSAACAECRLAARAAKGARDVAPLPLLQVDDEHHREAHEDIERGDQVVQHAFRPAGENLIIPSPCGSA